MTRVVAQLSVHVLTPSPGCSQGHYISKCIALIQKHPVKYEINALSTTIEGEMDDILSIMKECQLLLHKQLDVDKVHIQLTVMSYKRDATGMQEAVEKVKQSIPQD